MTQGTSFPIDSALSAATILIVDDEPANVKLLHQVLLHSGYQHIVQTADPRDVAEIVKTKAIDLAIFDLMMPELSGTDLIAILEQELGADCPPVLILTAASSMEARIEALDAGARDYVNKPFSIPELTARVKNLLEMHLLQKWIRDENQLLGTRVAERTEALYNTPLEIIRRLGRAAEYRDNETGMHIIRMSKTSALLAGKLGYTASASKDFVNAAPMHDIGKIGIPDYVLLKPGKLSRTEWQIMQTHAQIGADILHGTDSPLLEFAAEIALSHHENGTVAATREASKAKTYYSAVVSSRSPMSMTPCVRSEPTRPPGRKLRRSTLCSPTKVNILRRTSLTRSHLFVPRLSDFSPNTQTQCKHRLI